MLAIRPVLFVALCVAFCATAFADERVIVTVDGEQGYYFTNGKMTSPSKGGFVSQQANVQEGTDIFIGPSAKILGSASVQGNARVYGNAVVNGAEVGGDAKVYGNVRIEGNVVIEGKARVFGDAYVHTNEDDDLTISGQARVYGHADVSGNVTVEERAKVFGSAVVRGNALIGGEAIVKGDTLIETGEVVEGVHNDDRTPPTLTIAAPNQPLAPDVEAATITVQSDEPLASLTADGAPQITGDPKAGPFAVNLPVPVGGKGAVTLVARDAAGNETKREVAASRLSPSQVGWHGETLPKGMRKADEDKVYLWSAPAGLAIQMVYVPPGDFTMGSAASADEKPVHTHPMPVGYYVGRFETTWREYLAYCAARGANKPGRPKWAGDNHPVVNVSQSDAQAFCDWAGLALPSEAQWEKAARGTDERTYPWGNESPTADRCIWEGHPTYGGKSAAPVGSTPRGTSPYGAYDMAGNVWEWCADFYDDAAYRRYATGDTTPPRSGSRRVYRGGSWYYNASHARAAGRDHSTPSLRYHNLGFRPARVAP